VLVVADRKRHHRQLLERSGTDFFSTYGLRYGRTEEQVIDYYMRELER
jgi:hypothetical protein